MKRLDSFMKKTDIYILSGLPLTLGLIIIIFGCNVLVRFNAPCNDFGLGIVGILGSLITSLTGFAQIYRREAPGFHPKYPFRGRLAVIIGSIWVAFCWGGVFYIIYNLITH